jgi:diacylglycerol O-acyltransferase / wax synthase
MRRLSGLDPMFFYLETSTVHMQVAYVCILDPSTASEEYSFATVRAQLEQRLHLLPPFRQRLVEVPLGLDHPRWVEDPDFDLDHHLHQVVLASPGGESELADFTADVLSRPLDRSRPPWEMYVIEGLRGGLAALLTRVHHAAVDGVSGEELVLRLLDPAPEPTVVDPPDPPWRSERVPSDLELLGDALVELCRRPAAAARATWRTARAGKDLLGHARQSGLSAVSLPLAAPRTPLGVPLGPERRVAFAQVSLDEVKLVKGAFDVTVNDVVLAICSGALRNHLDALGDQPETSAVAIVPVSVRAEHQRGTMGNRLSAMFVSLASVLDNPVQRLWAINHATRRAKAQERAAAFDSVGAAWIEAAVPALVAPAIRLGSRLGVVRRVRPGNVIISNIVGPPNALYFAGARLVGAYPMGPIIDGIGLNITVQSYLGSLYFGLMTSPNTVIDVWNLAHGLTDALHELVKAASVSPISGNDDDCPFCDRTDEHEHQVKHIRGGLSLIVGQGGRRVERDRGSGRAGQKVRSQLV